MRPKHDSLLIGIAAGLVITVIGYFVALAANQWISGYLNRPFAFKQSTVALFAVCLNMFAISTFRRRYMNKALRGILVLMMALAVAWFFYFGTDLLNR